MLGWLSSQLTGQYQFVLTSLRLCYRPSRIIAEEASFNTALDHLKRGGIASFLLLGTILPLPEQDLYKILLTFGWVGFLYLNCVISSWVTEYFVTKSGGRVPIDTVAIAIAYTMGSSTPLIFLVLIFMFYFNGSDFFINGAADTVATVIMALFLIPCARLIAIPAEISTEKALMCLLISNYAVSAVAYTFVGVANIIWPEWPRLLS